VTSGGLAESVGGTAVSRPISESETARDALPVVGLPHSIWKPCQKLGDREVGDRSGSEKGADEGSWKEKGSQMSKGGEVDQFDE
jgi:hypothetical protein